MTGAQVDDFGARLAQEMAALDPASLRDAKIKTWPQTQSGNTTSCQVVVRLSDLMLKGWSVVGAATVPQRDPRILWTDGTHAVVHSDQVPVGAPRSDATALDMSVDPSRRAQGIKALGYTTGPYGSADAASLQVVVMLDDLRKAGWLTLSVKDAPTKQATTAKIDDPFPHRCPRCQKKAYVGILQVEHASGGGCG